jgi:hypothetical protein
VFSKVHSSYSVWEATGAEQRQEYVLSPPRKLLRTRLCLFRVLHRDSLLQYVI